jgi:hypothetical protein
MFLRKVFAISRLPGMGGVFMIRRFSMLAFLAAACAAQEIHGVYRLGGQQLGSYREATAREGGALITTVNSDMIFNRLGSKLEMKWTTRFEESTDGTLLRAVNDSSSSQQATHAEARMAEGELNIATTTADKTYERTVPFTGKLLGPAAARRLVASLKKAGETLSYQTFSPQLGMVVTIEEKLICEETVGRVRALKVEESMSAMPTKVTTWVDHEGWMLRQSMPGPLGDIETERTETATAVEGATLPEETFLNSVVKANIRLPEERLLESVTLRLTHKRPELGWPELASDNQQVLEKTRDSVILKITRPEPQRSAPEGSATESGAAMKPYLAANALLQSDDAAIVNIAREVVGKERDPWRAARALQIWTSENMQFDAGIAIAPASEVARNRRGTCFGYSMLLGALTRAAGIPSRLRMGYVYAGGIWGGHAWIDVRIAGRWIPLDAALYSPGAADAARFSFFTSALEEGTLAQIGSLAQLFGNVDVAIVEYTVDGRLVAVPGNAEPYSIEGNTYRDPWLGFSIEKPGDFRFTGAGAAWPNKAVVAMEGPGGRRVEVENLSASLPVKAHGEDSPASRTIAARGAVWVVKASGEDAAELVKRIASTLVLDRR